MTNPNAPDRVEEARAVLKHWLDETPQYMGDAPKALHYQRNTRALETALAALSGAAGEDVESAAKALMAYRVGDLPAQGWLRDNSASRAALGALAAALASRPTGEAATIPAGYVLVPREPTEAMYLAGCDKLARTPNEVWSAMLHAAPTTHPGDHPGDAGEGLDGKVAAYVESYEFEGEGFCHVPTEDECALITDAIHGFISQHSASPTSAPAGDGALEAARKRLADWVEWHDTPRSSTEEAPPIDEDDVRLFLALSTQATDREKVLEEALRPFADKATQFSDQPDGLCTIQIDFRHLRHAARALAQAPSEAGR